MLGNLTAYDILNALVPGTLLSVALSGLTSFDLAIEQQGIAIVVYFGIGMITSRIGSLILEPFCLKIKLISRENSYEDYVVACEKDSKIERLVEVANLYRTMASASLIFMSYYLYALLSGEVSDSVSDILTINSIVIVLFLLSWRKQESYIFKRVEVNS